MFGGIRGIASAFIALVLDIYLSSVGFYPLNLLPMVAVWAYSIPFIGALLFWVLNFIVIWLIIAVILAVVTE